MPLKDRKVIVTGGPTREWIDPVRYISNPSSGRMGVAIAEEASKRAGEALFIHGPMQGSLLKDLNFRTVAIETTNELLDAVVKELTSNTVLIMAAAPADYAPAEKSTIKLKKDKDELVLKLKKNPDILKSIAAMRKNNFSLKNIFAVGFAAETNNLEEYALGKLKEKDLEMICVNDVSRKDAGFGIDTNIVTIYTKAGEKIELPLLSKQDTAKRILDYVEAGLSKMSSGYLSQKNSSQ